MKISENIFPMMRSRWAVAALSILLMLGAVSSCSDEGEEHQMSSTNAEAPADPHAGHDMGQMSESPQMSPVDHSQHSDPLKQKAEVWSLSLIHI